MLTVWATVSPETRPVVGVEVITYAELDGVAAEDEVEAAEVPRVLVPVTLNVYGVPLVSPETSQLLLDVVQVKPPGEEVAVYEVTAGRPVWPAEAVQDTAAFALPQAAETPVGAFGRA